MDILVFLSEFMVPLAVFYIVGFGILSGRPVFDDFLKGASEGMKTVAGILPTLIGLMAAVGILRESGFLEAAAKALRTPAGSGTAVHPAITGLISEEASGSRFRVPTSTICTCLQRNSRI